MRGLGNFTRSQNINSLMRTILLKLTGEFFDEEIKNRNAPPFQVSRDTFWISDEHCSRYRTLRYPEGPRVKSCQFEEL